ncbi:hypothetical protein [Paraburkholderia elongata]|uniref:Uncharacterized protein n=1 Tax=Paraburkholderia elongata TaxID=2675747 RepID=A0A972NNE2_9BURK|nr:hypothetical protein [Paraburkholderia elongata]NPT55463.1 hypothetical protein [Paraburkholderia elongata]
MNNGAVLIALIASKNTYDETSLYAPNRSRVEKICNGCLTSQIGVNHAEMGDGANSIADGALEMAEKCWAFGVTFPRDGDFAAELSLFYRDEAASRERGAPDKR